MSAVFNPVPISAADKAILIAMLRESRERFLSSFAGIAHEQSRVRPADGCWCVLDTVEHIAAAESVMLGLLIGPRRPRPANAPNREQFFLERMPERERKAVTPESARPKGRFPDLEAAAGDFQASRERVVRFVEEATEDLRATEVAHPHAMVGNVSAYELVIIIAKHAERHAMQIEEIRNSQAFRNCGAEHED